MQQPNNSPLSGRKKALLCACNYFGTSNQLGGEIFLILQNAIYS